MPPSSTPHDPSVGPLAPVLHRALATLAAVAAITLAARLEVPVPGAPVPQSLQSLGVVVAGGLLGARRGAGALALYVVLGAAGLPVFSGGGAGMERLTGPSAGYLAGFVGGAAAMGWWAGRQPDVPPGRSVGWLLAGALVAHAIILGAGWARLGPMLGWNTAWQQGVVPFLAGGAAKSLAAALLLAIAGRARAYASGGFRPVRSSRSSGSSSK